MKLWGVILILCTIGGTRAVPPVQRSVTNEDIRDAILSVVHMLRSIEDKLERHEFRERALADHIKKNLGTLDKRLKLLDPVKGTVSRLDERLATVETILMQKDERERVQLQKTFDTVDDIQKNLPSVMEKLKSDIIDKIGKAPEQKDGVKKKDLDNIQEGILKKLEDVSKTTAKIEGDVIKIQKDNEVFKNESRKSADNFDRVKKQLSSSELMLEKYEHKLSEINNKVQTEIVPIDYKEQKDWQQGFMNALDAQQSNIGKISTDIKSISEKLGKLPQKVDLENAENSTLNQMQELKEEAVRQTERSVNLLDAKFKQLMESEDKKQDEVIKSLNDLSEMTEGLTENLGISYEGLKTELASLPRLEQVLMQTADGVIDTKRRVEYGVHQILLEVGNLVKEHGEKVNSSINERFDSFELSVLDGESGALANLTSKIGQEIDQVWRQIGIMHQQMSASTDTLNKLQNQTDSYVNGSLDIMDSMKGKVVQITGRMSEVDENLNYLMGKLSLVTHEFNQIKSGLGKALDQIKSSFKEVQDKIKDAGPGPHNIASDELDDNNNINSNIK